MRTKKISDERVNPNISNIFLLLLRIQCFFNNIPTVIVIRLYFPLIAPQFESNALIYCFCVSLWTPVFFSNKCQLLLNHGNIVTIQFYGYGYTFQAKKSCILSERGFPLSPQVSAPPKSIGFIYFFHQVNWVIVSSGTLSWFAFIGGEPFFGHWYLTKFLKF